MPIFLLQILAEAERIIAVLSRRGINFVEFIENYYDGAKLPCFRICVEQEQELYYERDDYEERLEELKEQSKSPVEGEEDESLVAEELHEVGRINQINEKTNRYIFI